MYLDTFLTFTMQLLNYDELHIFEGVKDREKRPQIVNIAHGEYHHILLTIVSSSFIGRIALQAINHWGMN